MNTKLRVALALIGALLVKFILLGHQGMPAGFITWTILAAILWAILGAAGRSSGMRPASMPADFKPAFNARNIALDTTSNRVWLHPDRGGSIVLDRSQISAWTHEWMTITAGLGMGQKRDNRIVFTIKDLSRPTLTVKFSTYRLAEEWQARLTAWKNA